MIVYATKVSVKKAIAGVLVIGAVVLGVTALMPKAAETVDAQAAAGEVDLDTKLKKQRAARRATGKLRLEGGGGAAQRARGADPQNL